MQFFIQSLLDLDFTVIKKFSFTTVSFQHLITHHLYLLLNELSLKIAVCTVFCFKQETLSLSSASQPCNFSCEQQIEYGILWRFYIFIGLFKEVCLHMKCIMSVLYLKKFVLKGGFLREMVARLSAYEMHCGIHQGETMWLLLGGCCWLRFREAQGVI